MVVNMHSERNGRPATERGPANQGTDGGERLIDSATLLAGKPMVRIRHANSIYTLRQTRQGKLILTK